MIRKVNIAVIGTGRMGSVHVANLVRQVPLERLLIETDAPYLTPHPRRGRRNEPACVVLTAQKVAELKGVSLDEVGRETSRNAMRLFDIPRKAKES